MWETITARTWRKYNTNLKINIVRDNIFISHEDILYCKNGLSPFSVYAEITHKGFVLLLYISHNTRRDDFPATVDGSGNMCVWPCSNYFLRALLERANFFWKWAQIYGWWNSKEHIKILFKKNIHRKQFGFNGLKSTNIIV